MNRGSNESDDDKQSSYSNSSHMSNDSGGTNRRAHRIQNLLQQEKKMDVSIEEGFLNHIGAHSGESIKASLLAA